MKAERATTATITIVFRGEEMDAFEDYVYTYMMKTGNVDVKKATLARRIILDWLKKNKKSIQQRPKDPKTKA